MSETSEQAAERVEAVANYFIIKADETKTTLSPMKLLKLCYFAYGCFYAWTGRPLFRDVIEAWTYGPVIPNLYHQIKCFGNDNVNIPLVIYSIEKGKKIIPEIENSETERALDAVWNRFGNYSAARLSAITHWEGSPWKTTKDKKKGVSQIDPLEIKNYFLDNVIKRT